MRADGLMRKEVRESHRGMVDGCRWNGGGMGYRVAVAMVSYRDDDELGVYQNSNTVRGTAFRVF